MKIVEEPIVEYQQNLKVSTAKYISDYIISLTFSNGIEREIDFGTFLTNSQHPSVRKYLNIDEFRQFKVVKGNLNWNDYDLIFPLSDLLKGTIA